MSARDYVEKDYYKVLGVPKDATAAEIKKAYRKLAVKLHPDKFGGDTKTEERFKEVSEAYDVLSDDARRKEYDEARTLFASGGFRVPGAGGPGGFGTGTNGFDLGDLFANARTGAGGLGDLFGGLFGGGGTRTTTQQPRRGNDLSTEVSISFEDAFRGLETSVRLPGAAACDTCRGTGAKPGTMPKACPVCGGVGLVTSNQGGFAFSEPCRACRGTGSLIETPCPDCGGTGRRERVQKLRIPAGVRDGQKVRVRGRGTLGDRGGPNGDLEVAVHVQPHPVFGRSGDNLTVTVPVTFPEAALGATISVPTLDGPVTLKVPAGTTNGRRLRVRGRGFPKKGGARGDLLVTLEVAVPSKLSAKAKSALETFAAETAENPRAHLMAMVGEFGGAS